MNDDFTVFNSDWEIIWKYYNSVAISKCDFDGDGIRDDILAVGSKIYALSAKGKVLSSYTKDDIKAEVVPAKFKGVQCLVFDSDGIANDAAILGYVSKQGYYVYGASDIVEEAVEAKPEAEKNKPPIASAGEDITVKEDEEVVLSALDSYDEDGEIISYTWVEGEKILSYNPAFSVKLEPGVHVIILKVRDDKGATSMDSVTVKVLPSEEKEEVNLPPVAEAGEDLNLTLGEIANLSASQSYDPDGEIISYQWSFQGRIISTEENFGYEFPVGEHLIKLKVIDNKGAEAEDEIRVVVLPEKEEEKPLRSFSATAFAFVLTLIVFLRRRYIG